MDIEIEKFLLQLPQKERQLVTSLVETIALAGESLRNAQINGHLATRQKSDKTVVTDADEAAQAILIDGIQPWLASGDNVIAEEGEIDVSNGGSRTFFIDPLDGTRAFSEGSEDYCVLLSVWDGANPYVSIAFYPAIEEWTVAVRGQLVSSHPVSIGRFEYGGLLACYMPQSEVVELWRRSSLPVASSSLESTRALIEVATNRATAASVLMCGHKSWDMAAVVHFCRAAGLVTTDLFAKPITLVPSADIDFDHVIVAPERLWAETLLATRLAQKGTTLDVDTSRQARVMRRAVS